MTIRFADQTETANWNKHILANPDGGNILQSYEFAQQKKFGGWKPLFVMADNLAITILQKNVLILGKLWYIPKGPEVKLMRQLDALLPELKLFADQHGVFAVKIEPELLKTNETLADLLKLGLVRVSPIQPNFSTILLDISDNLDTVMAHLNQKGRHAIKRAKRDGVTVKLVDTSDENCEKMYHLLAQTAAGSFRIRDYHYYKAFWQRFNSAGLGQLFFAYVDDQLIAGAYAVTFGKKGTYKDGASVRQRSVYGASHLLQWNVIRWAKSREATIHDLCGAPPSDQINNPDHPHHGIGQFKTSFNKEVTDYVGAYDIIIKPTQYKLWANFGERIVTRLHSYRHHENYY
jgi:lipid II:glycine glycyltransferase (peptidoglycan interpeptide bridge formation enzyme)